MAAGDVSFDDYKQGETLSSTCVHVCSRGTRFSEPEECQNLTCLYKLQARLISSHQSLLACLLCPFLADDLPVG